MAFPYPQHKAQDISWTILFSIGLSVTPAGKPNFFGRISFSLLTFEDGLLTYKDVSKGWIDLHTAVRGTNTQSNLSMRRNTVSPNLRLDFLCMSMSLTVGPVLCTALCKQNENPIATFNVHRVATVS